MSERLIDSYDVAFFDLDGVVYLGPHAVDGAVGGIQALHQAGVRTIYVTNNAARSADSVAAHLRDLGFDATADDLVTSAQAAAHELVDQLPAGAKILVAGTQNLVQHMTDAGFVPVTQASDNPVAVIQGYDPQMTWPRLDEAAVAVQNGARWFATNTDSTRPTERGLVPGAGMAVAAVQACVDVMPTVFGKPYRPLLDEAIRRTGAQRPIFVGDRIDTDIVGARRVGIDSILVFTGVHGKADLVTCAEDERPTTIGWGIPALLDPMRVATVIGDTAKCREQVAEVSAGRVVLLTEATTYEEQLDALWAIAQLAWQDPRVTVAAALSALDLVH